MSNTSYAPMSKLFNPSEMYVPPLQREKAKLDQQVSNFFSMGHFFKWKSYLGF